MKRFISSVVLILGVSSLALADSSTDSAIVKAWKQGKNKGICQVVAPCDVSVATVDPNKDSDAENPLVRMRLSIAAGLQLNAVIPLNSTECVYTFSKFQK